MALGALLRVRSPRGEREVPIAQWYKGVGKVDLAHEELLVKIVIPRANCEGYTGHYIKYAMRSAMDIATLGVSCLVKLSADKRTVEEARLAFGVAVTFSIVIGLVQIIFGKCVAAYKIKIQKGTKHSIAPFAWVFVIISLALAFGLPMLNVHLPNAVVMVCYGIAILGLVVAYLYNTPGKNVFLNFGTGLWNTYNMGCRNMQTCFMSVASH